MKGKINRILAILSSVLVISGCGGNANQSASDTDSPSKESSEASGVSSQAQTAKLINLLEFSGDVKAILEGEENDVYEGMRFIDGDGLKTQNVSAAVLDLDKERYVMVDENSQCQFEKVDKDNVSIVLKEGHIVNNIAKKSGKYEVKAGNVAMGVLGTIFDTFYLPKIDLYPLISLYEGNMTIRFQNPNDPHDTRSFELAAGFSFLASPENISAAFAQGSLPTSPLSFHSGLTDYQRAVSCRHIALALVNRKNVADSTIQFLNREIQLSQSVYERYFGENSDVEGISGPIPFFQITNKTDSDDTVSIITGIENPLSAPIVGQQNKKPIAPASPALQPPAPVAPATPKPVIPDTPLFAEDDDDDDYSAPSSSSPAPIPDFTTPEYSVSGSNIVFTWNSPNNTARCFTSSNSFLPEEEVLAALTSAQNSSSASFVCDGSFEDYIYIGQFSEDGTTLLSYYEYFLYPVSITDINCPQSIARSMPATISAYPSIYNNSIQYKWGTQTLTTGNLGFVGFSGTVDVSSLSEGEHTITFSPTKSTTEISPDENSGVKYTIVNIYPSFDVNITVTDTGTLTVNIDPTNQNNNGYITLSVPVSQGTYCYYSGVEKQNFQISALADLTENNLNNLGYTKVNTPNEYYEFAFDAAANGESQYICIATDKGTAIIDMLLLQAPLLNKQPNPDISEQFIYSLSEGILESWTNALEQSGNRDEDEIINNSNTGIKIKLDSSTEYLNFENNFFLSTTTDTNMASNLNVSWISAENTSKDSDDKDFNLIIATAISDVSIPS